jgi:hypothetical protein
MGRMLVCTSSKFVGTVWPLIVPIPRAGFLEKADLSPRLRVDSLLSVFRGHIPSRPSVSISSPLYEDCWKEADTHDERSTRGYTDVREHVGKPF